MLADWYFCCCIKAPVTSAATYLTLLDTLRDSSSDAETIAVAVSQLRKTDTWMRGYALPPILQLLRRDSLRESRSTWLDPYFAELIETFPQPLVQPFHELQAIVSSDEALTSEPLLSCISVLPQSDGPSPSDSPHLDLPAYIPHAYTLAAIVECAIQQRVSTSTFEQSHADERLMHFIEAALRRDYGRLPFVLALEAVSRLKLHWDLRHRIWHDRKRAALEPDILRAYAASTFVWNDPLCETGEIVDKLVDEIVTLSVLRQQFGADNAPSNVTITDANPDVRGSLAIVLWQATLAELAAEINPPSAAARLSPLWACRHGSNAGPVRVSGPVNSAKRRVEWKTQIERLLCLGQPHLPSARASRDGRPERHGARERSAGPHAVAYTDYSPTVAGDAAVFCSPWLNRIKGQAHQRYPTAENEAALARLLAATIISAQLLRSGIEQGAHESRIRLAAVLVHGYDVLFLYRQWFRKQTDSRRDVAMQPTLSRQWTVLALYARDLITRIGRCASQHIDPELFMSLLEPDVFGGLEAGSDQARVFRSHVAPGVLVDWVVDAYGAAVGADGAGRWIPCVPRLYEACSAAADIRHRVDAATLMRFLIDRDFSEPKLDWRTATMQDGTPRCWNISHRQLFLTPGLKAVDWNPPWDEAEGAVRQVRAIERRAALGHADGLPAELVHEWQRQWLNELGDVAQLKDLDRFVRVRLVELLDEPALAKNEDEQLVIAMTILDYGSHYDLSRMFEQLFAFDDNGKLLEPITAQRKYVRAQVIEAMLKYVRRRHTGPEPDGEAQTPGEVTRALGRHRIIEEWLWKLAYSAACAGADDASFATNLRELCDRNHQSHTRRLVRSDIELAGAARNIVWRSDDLAPPEWAVGSLSCDWTTYVATAAVEMLETGDCLNLFEWNCASIRKFEQEVPDVQRRQVLAVVVEESEERPLHRYVLNCGFARTLPAFRSQRQFHGSRPVKVGDFVRVRLRWVQQSDRAGWRAQAPLEPLALTRGDGSIDVLTLEEDRQRRRVELRVAGAYDPVEFDIDEWDLDYSRTYSTSIALERYLASLQENRWVPVDRSFAEFVLHGFGGCSVVVATFVGRSAAAAGAADYRFSLGFGEHYRIPVETVDEHDRAELEEKLGSGDQRGLLVAFAAACWNRQVRLKLAQNVLGSEDASITASYPKLQLPFDDRNIRWRRLDEQLAGARAVLRGRHWEVNTRKFVPEPFPASLKVLPERPIDQSQRVVEIEPTKWNARTGELRVDVVSYHTLKVPEKNRATVVTRWLSLRRNDIVEVRGTRPRPNDEQLTVCRTTEGFGVFVESDSLTMRPLAEALVDNGIARSVEMTVVSEWSPVKTFTVNAAALPPAIAGTRDGMLATVPRADEAGASLYGIWWIAGDEVLPWSMTLPGLSEVRPFLGMKVTVAVARDAYVLQIHRRRTIGRALWEGNDLSTCECDDLRYLGAVRLEGVTRHVAEGWPGQLVFLPAPVAANHLGRGLGAAFQGGVRPNDRVTVIPPANPKQRPASFEVQGVRYSKALLKIGALTLGATVAQPVLRQGVLVSARMTCEPCTHGGATPRFRVRRYFALGSAAAVSRASNEAEHRKRQLKEYFEKPTVIEGTLEQQKAGQVIRTTFWVPTPDDPASWTTTIRIAEGHGAFIDDAGYPAEAKVRLLDAGETGVFASCRLVPPVTVAAYRESLSVVYDHEVHLLERLYYVGPEAGSEGCHRFEWRAGCTVLAHESQLRFDGDRFAQAKGILFPGDAITRVRFTKHAAVESECVVEIEQVHLEFADGTTLFQQRDRLKLIHVLDVVGEDEALQVDAVIGFSDRRLDEWRAFHRVRHARVIGLDVASLNARSEDDTARPGIRRRILGRLDSERFLDTLGKDLVFEHVRMSFENASTGSPLRNGELVFMRGGKPFSHIPNDVALSLVPYDGLSQQDIGRDCARCLVPRREFSVRDDLLPRLLRRNPEACENRVYLVRLRQDRGTIYTSLLDRAPTRRLSALIAAAQASLVFGAVIDSTASSVRIELQPGVFFDIPRDAMECSDDALGTGACVRIEYSRHAPGLKGRFRLSLAIPGHVQYVPPGGRPALALPKNPLLRKDVPARGEIGSVGFWTGRGAARNKPFSIAGLSGIEPTPGSLSKETQEWSAPSPDKFIRLMQATHPDRLVHLGRDERGDLRIAPLNDGRWSCGKLLIGERAPSIAPMSDDASSVVVALTWSNVSFADDSIAAIEKLCRESWWTCHDEQSGSWAEDRVVHYPLRRSTTESGPLFLDTVANQPTLRYRVQMLATFGFPPQELFEALAQPAAEERLFPIAGHSERGLWIEVAPGHVAELPGQLLVYRCGSGERSLANLHWRCFGQGDRVSLGVASDDAFRVDKVLLRRWYPGARGAMGGTRSFLPISARDASEGVVLAGAGEFCLRLPTRDPFPSGRIVLGEDNVPLDAGEAFPRHGDTVLLGLVRGGPAVLGWPELRPSPDRDDALWRDDELAEQLRGSDLAAVISAAGGALPVTVKAVVQTARRLYFSRRIQAAAAVLEQDCVAQCSVMGLLPDHRTLLLRCGAAIFKAGIADVVRGLPPDLAQPAFDALKTADTPVWAVATGDASRVRFGICVEAREEFPADLVCSVSEQKRDQPCTGFICRSRESEALYWMPAEHAAWAALSPDEVATASEEMAKQAFLVRAVARRRSTFASRVAVGAVAAEFRRLAVGMTLEARLIRERLAHEDDLADHRWLAEISGAHMLIECSIPAHLPEASIGERRRMEVVRRTGGACHSLFVVPLGEKTYTLDLPAWVFSADVKAGKELPAQRQYREADSETVPMAFTPAEVRELTTADLDRALVQAWHVARNGGARTPVRARLEITIARTWIGRNQSTPEVPAALGIMAVLLLHNNGKKLSSELSSTTGELAPNDLRDDLRRSQREAVEFARVLARRALHSPQSEVMARQWLRPKSPERMDDLSRRLDRLRALLSPRLQIADVQLIRQFCRAADLRASVDLAIVSLALRAALGEPVDLKRLLEHEKVTGGLAELLCLMPEAVARYPLQLPASCAARLEMLLSYMQEHDLYVSLLAPLNSIASPQADSASLQIVIEPTTAPAVDSSV